MKGTFGVLVGELVLGAYVEYAHEHFGHFFADKRQRPREHVHEVGQPVRMRRTVELAYVHHVVLVFEYGRFVIVDVEIVGRRENGYQRWKCRL